MRKILLILFLLFAFFTPKLIANSDEVNLALVASFSGESSVAGVSFERSVRLAIKNINEAGGINGQLITLTVFDDENDPEIARNIAKKLVTENIHAVIGHHYSNVSLAASPIYKDAGIPVISPSSTADEITRDNPWYFRTIFSNHDQAKFIANYINNIFDTDSVAIINENQEYGRGLATVFSKTSDELGLIVRHQIDYNELDIPTQNRISSFIDELKEHQFNGVIFLATQAPDGANLVKQLRDAGIENTIFVPDAFASESFTNMLREELTGNSGIQFYTNNIFVASPLIYDSANEMAQQFYSSFNDTYQTPPDWRAAYAYDAVLVLAEAISKIGQAPSEIAQYRKSIKDALAAINSSENAVAGVTGYNYFNEIGDIQKPISVGNFGAHSIVSSLTQFTTISSISDITDIDHALLSNQIVRFDDTYMYRTDVVFTGIQIQEVKNFNAALGTYELNFNLWLRHHGNSNATKINFLNAISPIELGDPVFQSNNGAFTYQQYQINGEFKTNFAKTPPPFRNHQIGISLRNTHQARENLIYVSDLTGMGFMENEHIIKQIRDSRIIDNQSNWIPVKAFTFADIDQVNTLGRPEHMLKGSSTAPFSTFNYVIELSENNISMPVFIPEALLSTVFVISWVVLLLLIVVRRYLKKHVKAIISSISILLFLLAGKQLFTDQMVGVLDIKYLYLNETIFNVLSWLLPAILLILFVEWFLWQTLETKTERKIPSLVRGITAVIIVAFACFGIMAFVLEQRLTSLLGASGLAAMILGLALQVNLANIFSGIALNLERPLRVGDWVKLGDSTIGQVVTINWRTTRIKTLFENTISIPNGKVSEDIVENYNYPEDKHFAGFTIYLDHKYAPEKIISILEEAVLSTPGFSEPWVIFSDYTDWSAEYKCFGVISDYGTHFKKKSALLSSIRTLMKQNNITPAIRRQELKMIKDMDDMKVIA
ncbi:MAG: ABC transporter substrate-binding protein [Balneolales bacterium]